VGISSNGITADSAKPAATGFQPRAAGPSAGHAPDNPTTSGAASQPGDASGPSSGGSAQGTGTAGGNGSPAGGGASSSAAQKTSGPSAQTRGNARARGRTNAAASASMPGAPDAPDTEADAGTDFGSAMATALGRSAASAAAPFASPPVGATPSAAASNPPAPDPATAPVDAIAWISQVLMPTASATDSDADGATGTVAAAPGQSAAALTSASLARFNAAGVPQAPTTATAPNDDAQTAATGLASSTVSGDANMLADIQKLVSGLTGTSASATDTDDDSSPVTAAPGAHSPATSDSNEATQAAAALQAAGLTHAGTDVGSTTLTIHAPVGSAAFADEVGARVAGLGQSGITQAQLQMNPADLGPVQVHITMQAGQASVWFGASHADTRAALEQSLPRLRELFAGAGMPLTDAGVFREPPQQQQAQSLPNSNSSHIADSDAVSTPTVTQVTNVRLALLDTYA
jgi:flagellar hook-length control protein FliK